MRDAPVTLEGVALMVVTNHGPQPFAWGLLVISGNTSRQYQPRVFLERGWTNASECANVAMAYRHAWKNLEFGPNAQIGLITGSDGTAFISMGLRLVCRF